MKRLLAAAAAILLVVMTASPVQGKVEPVSGSIVVTSPNPTYQQAIQFDWSVSGKLKGYEYPMVIVDCYQPDNPLAYDNVEPGLVYRELGKPTDTFVLGGGWSAWVESGGGPAFCFVRLMIYSGYHPYAPYEIARDPFEAAG